MTAPNYTGLLFEALKQNSLPIQSILKFNLNKPMAFTRASWLKDSTSEDLDGLILALACIHNDLKNSLFLMVQVLRPLSVTSAYNCHLQYRVFCNKDFKHLWVIIVSNSVQLVKFYIQDHRVF